jgi:putative nucleotidyltransferase with HDIG domain
LDQKDVTKGYVRSIEQSIKIHISELKVGMFVSKLDRPWLETPFLMQGFIIESVDDVDLVAQYSEYVWVDAVQQAWVPPEVHSQINATEKKIEYVNKVDVKTELNGAQHIYRKARQLTRSFLDDIRLGGAINTIDARSTVKHCVDSVLRNPDALIWMSKMRSQNEYTAEHCLNVCILAIAFGRHLGMSEEDLEIIGLCGLLHDVGKMRIPPEILNKPSALTDKEFNMIKAHTVHGRNLLMASPGIPNSTIDVAYSHHEKIDGSGYPRQLPASGISEFARIIALVDAYDAMTADRCYSEGKPSTEALKIIFKDRGTHFDERLALEFIKSVGLYPPGTLVELVNGLICIVLETNKHFRHLPKVIAINEQSTPLPKALLVDLIELEHGAMDKSFLIKSAHKDGAFGVRVKDHWDKGLM